ncbi:mitochondrial-like intermediate peptidase-like, partial [Trifolium medium]|nr:mitochondrial-like intermediate peptidase-like [Trifolium medium]
YYSYLYAKCFAATIWKKLCQEDSLSPIAGSALRTKFLQHGGARAPAVILNDLVPDGIYRYYDGGIIPDISSLCEEMELGKEHQQKLHLFGGILKSGKLSDDFFSWDPIPNFDQSELV